VVIDVTDPAQEHEVNPASPGWLTSGVLSVGLASFFSDSGHEITTSILPTFVTTTLRSSAGALGVIEGISDALLGVAKLIAGPFANDPRRRREIARGGYVVTAAATGAIGLAATVWQAGVLRAGSWVARGARSPARDALLASLVAPSAYGRAFGLERAGDNLGAVVGPLLAAVLVASLGIRPALYLAAVPGAFAAVAITAAAREATKRHTSEAPSPPRRRLEVRAVLGSGLARPLIAIGLFEFGNCATTLLILRATGLLSHGGRSVVAATSLAIVLTLPITCSARSSRWSADTGSTASVHASRSRRARCCLRARMRSLPSGRTVGCRC
jgi:predicted MFS family arabinose efflux permease